MTKYNYKNALLKSNEYFDNDEMAPKVFVDKYALQDHDGNYDELSPLDMFARLAKEYARIEAKYENPMSYEAIYDLFNGFKYIVPQGSPMSGIGNPYQIQSISNCFVIGSPLDSYASILKTDQEQIHIMRRRGGVGFDISHIRPKGMPTKNAAKTTDGIGIFMERFSSSCREVAQGNRRGALMLTISVHHPEIRTFLSIKKNLTKVTGANISIRVTDEFMNAVKNKEKVNLRWPVESDDPKISLYEDAEVLWQEIIEAAHSSAEPGILFWDNALKYTPAEIYKDYGFHHTSTNPCLTGDTKVAVADGRGFVSFENLVEEGGDVPVYANDNGKIVIKTMRNPRVTGYNKDVFKITLDDGSSFKCTDNHKLLLSDGSFKEVKDLKLGDSLDIGLRYESTIINEFKNQKSNNSKQYIFVKNSKKKTPKTEHRAIWEFNFGSIPKENVIHHVDFNSKNNSIENLQSLNKKDHTTIHAKHMVGANNPMVKIKNDPAKFLAYKKKQSIISSGENNPNYSGVSFEEIKEHACKLTNELGQRFSHDQWLKYAKDNNLPQNFSKYRMGQLGSISDLAMWAAVECGVEYAGLDPRLIRTLKKAIEQGYSARIISNSVFVSKRCESCTNEFLADYHKRESAFCSHACSAKYISRKSTKESININYENRVNKLRESYRSKVIKNKDKQIKVYLDLISELGTNVQKKDWEQRCKQDGVPFRLNGSSNSIKSWEDLKQSAKHYNHRISSIEYVGKEDVYNGTVDDVHNFYFGGWSNESDVYDNLQVMICGQNCGEIILSEYDSCRLMLINLVNFVENPFTDKAYFNYDKFADVTIKAQRLMDDMIDLELECIDNILSKIESDPEPDDVKLIEKNLWLKVKKACQDGRRTGLGVTGLGDCIAYLNEKYGSDKSIEITEEIYKTLAINSYKSSCILAAERGAFPVFNAELEKGHPFLQRIWDASPETYELYKKYGRRNISNTTTAPAGSVSILTRTTSGIEPVYKTSYIRRRKINPDSKNIKVDFIDQSGDSWQEYEVHHHGLKKWMEVTGNTDVTLSPYYGATALDLNGINGVKLQSAAQKWICHSISRTQNLPNDVSVDVVKDIYMTAWESGCKGYTVYRDGCRTGVLVNSSSKKTDSERPNKIKEAEAPKRPKELPCEIHHATVKGIKWLTIVGLLDGKPYEIFTGQSNLISLPNKCSAGKVTKQTKGRYDLHITISDEELIIRDIITTFNNPDSAWATRVISTSLRHGVPIDFIVDQLSKDGLANDYNKVIARILKKYIKDGSKIRTNESCENILDSGEKCGSKNIVYSEGCKKCLDCNWSKC